MGKLKKYNLDGKEVGEAQLCKAVAEAKASSQQVKDYLVAIRANKRQWSACTRDRSEVNHSTKKPHKQKGTGKARQGSLAAPQYKGGGVVFGPRPKFDQHVRINRKERRQAVRALLGEMAGEGRVVVVEDPKIDEPKTKTLAQFFKNAGLNKRTLFVAGGVYVDVETEGVKHRVSDKSPSSALSKSLRNIEKAKYTLVSNLNGYDVAAAHDVVFTESALSELNASEEAKS